MKKKKRTLICIILFTIGLLNLSAQEFWITTGNQEELCPPTVMDADMNTYNTIYIGDQCWMAENLNVGTIINSNYDLQTNNGIIEKYCYDNNEQYCVEYYGGLYMWDEMMNYSIVEGAQGICPEGWHIPSDAEWTALGNFLGGEAIAGGKMKATGTIEAGTGLWRAYNVGATNESGFSGLPGGFSNLTAATSVVFLMSFFEREEDGCFWSSTDIFGTKAFLRLLEYDFASVDRLQYSKTHGMSVRCLKDSSPLD